MKHDIPPILNHKRQNVGWRSSVVIAVLGCTLLLTVFIAGSQPRVGSQTQQSNPSQSPPSDSANAASQSTNSSSSVPTATPVVQNVPSNILDLINWKLTLPIGTQDGDPLEVKQPELNSFTHPDYFRINTATNGVIFGVHADGVTTSNSGYPRSELREMQQGGIINASWASNSGYHAMEITQAITALPKVKPEIVAGQIHDSDDDVVMIRLERKRLFVEADGEDIGLLDENYQLGKAFTVKIEVSNGRIVVHYNNNKKVDYRFNGGGLYFKAGAYLQSNPDKGDQGDAYGEVVIYKLKVDHR